MSSLHLHWNSHVGWDNKVFSTYHHVAKYYRYGKHVPVFGSVRSPCIKHIISLLMASLQHASLHVRWSISAVNHHHWSLHKHVALREVWHSCSADMFYLESRRMITGFQRPSGMKYPMPSDITTDPRERNVLDAGMAKIKQRKHCSWNSLQCCFYRGPLAFIPFGICERKTGKGGTQLGRTSVSSAEN